MPSPSHDLQSESLPRPRRRNRSDLPANLYEPRSGYFVWRNPVTGKTYSLGRITRGEARDQAIEANRVVEKRQADRLTQRLHAAQVGETFGDWIDRYAEILDRRNLKPNTMRQHKWRLKTMREQFGSDPVADLLEVRRWADWLDEFTAAGKARSAGAWRSWLSDCWREAVAAGWVDRNPIDVIRAPTAKVKRDRLTLEAALLILEEARASWPPWLARAIELALLTGQRREDIAAMQFRQRKDSTGWVDGDDLYVIQLKTGNRVALPLSLGLPALDMTIGDAVTECRDRIATPWLVHQDKPRGNSPPGSRIWVDTISRRFADVRDAVAEKHGQLWEDGKTPPSFHELRSLSLRLYGETHGADFSQALAGHKDARMTAVYRDVRGSEWVRVKA